MRIYICLSLFILYTGAIYAQLTPYEKGNKNVSATYDEIISWYRMLDKKSGQLSMARELLIGIKCWMPNQI